MSPLELEVSSMKKYIKQISWPRVLKRALPEEQRKHFELTEARIEKLKNFSQVLLAVLSVVGIATMVLIAPNALQALKIFEKTKERRGSRSSGFKNNSAKIIKTFYYLKQKNWVEFRRKGEDYEVTVTAQGKKQIRKMRLETLTIAKPEKWDGKFWLVIADIPTKEYRAGADAFRQKLKEMSFFHLQRTVWLYPFDPRLEIEFITRHYGIFNFVTVMKIDELDPADGKPVKKFFKKQGII